MTQADRFRGRTALITGGVSGIGFGIARAFALAGIDLVLTWRNAAHRETTAQWFADQGLPVPRFERLDVTDRARWADLAASLGPVHILVNNAGISVFGPTDCATHDDYDWIMGVNFGGVANALVAMLPGMKALTGPRHVINVASMAAFCAGPQAGIYTASKFAVRGLTESLRYNLIPYDIGVSLLCPGLTQSNAWDSALKRPEQFAGSGFPAVDAAELAQFGTAFDLGMDALEVGRKTLRGMIANHPLILTHPDHREDFEAIAAELLAALPDEAIPAGRAHIEALRRDANRAALAGSRIGISDLT
ncbi:SDR family oxidoreductase [Novosphingobium sp.]|uniref:SDR family oxidoreductase n=1 Tax=Novosphingobium sp. TaxID=1874826 RepID=UPI003340D6A9